MDTYIPADEQDDIFETLIGKTIVSMKRVKRYESFEDECYIIIKFSDETQYMFEGGHTGVYSPKAIDEYIGALTVEKL